MWLLHTTTLELRIFVSDIPRYAILSHVWEATDHTDMFQEMRAIYAQCRTSGRDPRGLVTDKVRNFCAFAERLDFEWVWLDTCCIDKSSSAELSEAINSMCAWYRNAAICYVYLCDVGDRSDPRAPNSEFRRSRWHTRGWTLQELVVPRDVTFLSRHWNVIGTKISLAHVLEETTSIQWHILVGRLDIPIVSVAQRFSWMSRRETTRVEDLAYSLLGIFGVHMPIVYGEGLEHAFSRLQKKILKLMSDQSIFVWGNIHPNFDAAFEALQWPAPDIISVRPWSSEALAKSPSLFSLCGEVEQAWLFALSVATREYTWTSQGLITDFDLSIDYIPCPSSQDYGIYAARLHYENAKEGSSLLLFLRMRVQDVLRSPAVVPLATVGYMIGREGSDYDRFYRGALLDSRTLYMHSQSDFRLTRICVQNGTELKKRQIRLGADRDSSPPRIFSAATSAKPTSFYIPEWCLQRMEAVNALYLHGRRIATRDGGHRIDLSTMDYANPIPLEIKFTNVTTWATLTFRFGPPGCHCTHIKQCRTQWWMEVYLRDSAQDSEPEEARPNRPFLRTSEDDGRMLKVTSKTFDPCPCVPEEVAATRGRMYFDDMHYCEPMTFTDGARSVNIEHTFTEMDPTSIHRHNNEYRATYPLHITMMIDIVGFESPDSEAFFLSDYPSPDDPRLVARMLECPGSSELSTTLAPRCTRLAITDSNSAVGYLRLALGSWGYGTMYGRAFMDWLISGLDYSYGSLV